MIWLDSSDGSLERRVPVTTTVSTRSSASSAASGSAPVAAVASSAPANVVARRWIHDDVFPSTC